MVNPSVKVRSQGNSQRGFSFFSIVAALAIIGILYFGYSNEYFSSSETAVARGTTTKLVTEEMACKMNRQAIEQAMMRWSITHADEQPTLQRLEREGILIKPCPQGGQFRLEGDRVYCSLHPD
ncbi:hypothetical protein MYX82_08685 [Acidobacteria bacterium AH-259-D05]|nr:hypothetical protein [Acidobacteria bacterium AH-259-D05]